MLLCRGGRRGEVSGDLGEHPVAQGFGGGELFFEQLHEAMILGDARPFQSFLTVGELATENIQIRPVGQAHCEPFHRSAAERVRQEAPRRPVHCSLGLKQCLNTTDLSRTISLTFDYLKSTSINHLDTEKTLSKASLNYPILTANPLDGGMSNNTYTARLASTLLKDAGLASIWRLNVAAAQAYRNGFPHAAAAILEIADAAEEECLRRQPLAFQKT